MRTAALLFIPVAGMLAAGAGRLIYLEETRGERLRSQAEEQVTSKLEISAQRGDILDTKGRVLAGSTQKPSVYVDARNVDDPKLAAYSIGPVLGLDPEALLALLIEKRDRGFVWVKRGISEEEFKRFHEVARTRKLDKVFKIQKEPERIYPQGRTAAHVLGFVGPDANSGAGIERVCDERLTGKPGERTVTLDVKRRALSSHRDKYVSPEDGNSVVLTIDTYIQQITEAALKKMVVGRSAHWGAAAVMDAHTGEVFAMATYPDFDPADPFPAGMTAAEAERCQERIRNRVVSDSIEPGSIFKPFIAGMAFDEGLVGLNEKYQINGPTRSFGQRTIHDTHGYGTLAFWEVISKSSNIGMGLLANKLGNERLYRYVRAFGFGDPTGITLPGEHDGLVNDFSRWGPFSTQSIPIGQELGVTPIQVLAAFSAFCNDGVLLRPRVIRGIVDAHGNPIEDNSRPIIIRRVMSAEAARTFRHEALGRVVAGGTGREAKLDDWQVFGKTGTAQVAKLGGGGYIPEAYCGSFVCGAPLREPRVAVVVSIYRPKGKPYYGGLIAAPVAKEILGATLEYLKVPKEALLESSDNSSASD